MKKSILFVLSILLVGSISTVQAASVKAEETASPSSEQTTQKLRERIEKVVEEKRDQVEGTISDLSRPRRGFIGEVQRVTQETITIKNHKGTQIISLNDSVSITKTGKAITLDDVAVGDWVIMIGVIEDDAFTPQKMIVSSNTLRPKEHVVALGSVTKRDAKSITVLTRTGETVVMQLAKTTRFQDNDASKATADEFVEDMQVLVVGYADDKGKYATTVRAIVPLDTFEKEDE